MCQVYKDNPLVELNMRMFNPTNRMYVCIPRFLYVPDMYHVNLKIVA